MLIKHYRNRLPADYDMDIIRRRIAERGPLWDGTTGLVFKAFGISDRSNGAAANSYAPLYLWRDPGEAVRFLTDERFAAVIATFGRPSYETWLPFDIRIGASDEARFLTREDRLIDDTTDLAALAREEAAMSREAAVRPETVACVVGLGPSAWQLSRFTLLAERPAALAYAEIAHFSRPGLSELRHRQSSEE